MSENESVTADAGETQETTTEAEEFKAITSQADFDAAIQKRIERERKKIPADYDDLKAKAEKFAEWEESQKSETEKRDERQKELERENAELKSGKLRADVANAKGVPAELLSGSTQEELEAAADALIEFRGEQKQAPADKKTLYVPDEGGVPAIGKEENITPGMGTLRAAYSQE